jgi:ABC-2 type transport system ATP-binding protein
VSPDQRPQLFADTFAWLNQYVAGTGQGADAVPVFQWWDQNADYYTSDLLPFQDGFNQMDPYSATGAGGTLGIIPFIAGSGSLLAGIDSFPLGLVLPTPADNAINVALTPAVGEQIVGAPQLSFTYRGLGTGQAVFAQLVDDATGLVVGNQVTAVPLTLDGREHTVSMPLYDIAYTVGAGDSLTLQIVSWSSIFANATIGVVDISDIQVDLALREISPVMSISTFREAK